MVIPKRGALATRKGEVKLYKPSLFFYSTKLAVAIAQLGVKRLVGFV